VALPIDSPNWRKFRVFQRVVLRFFFGMPLAYSFLGVFWGKGARSQIRMIAKRGLEKGKEKGFREFLAAFGLVTVFLALWYCWFLSPQWERLAALGTASSLVVSHAIENSYDASFSEPAPQIYTAHGSGREVFPYSVIPGGVHSSSELANAIAQDAQVAEHYGDFRLRAAHEIRLEKDRQAYVSYRLGGKIYWTQHKVTLHAGETLLTDGRNLARGRCGNRVSDSPKLPVSPKEPADRAMSTPVFVPDPLPLGYPIGDSPLALVTLPPENFGPPPSRPPGGPPTPFFPPIFLGGPGGPSRAPWSPPPPPPPAATPEPASGRLVLLGLVWLAAVGLILRK
jgi:hypothetical protein